MARHRKSKAIRVSVNPQSTERYVVGVLTGADAYITGLLSGTNLYDSWAQVEGELEGKKLTPYQQDQMKNALNDPSLGPIMRKAFYNPQALSLDEKAKITTALTNYNRVKEVDEYMIDAGEKYRNEYFENAYKSKSMQLGLNKLESEGMKSGVIKDRVGNVLSKLMYNF
jgi:hypothetical protein